MPHRDGQASFKPGPLPSLVGVALSSWGSGPSGEAHKASSSRAGLLRVLRFEVLRNTIKLSIVNPDCHQHQELFTEGCCCKQEQSQAYRDAWSRVFSSWQNVGLCLRKLIGSVDDILPALSASSRTEVGLLVSPLSSLTLRETRRNQCRIRKRGRKEPLRFP